MKPQVIVGIPAVTVVEKSSELLAVSVAKRVGECNEVPAIPLCPQLRAVVAKVDQVPYPPLLVDAPRRLATGSLGPLVAGVSSLCQVSFQIEAEAKAVLSCGRLSWRMHWHWQTC